MSMFLFFLARFAAAFKLGWLANVESFIHDKLVCLGLLRLSTVNVWVPPFISFLEGCPFGGFGVKIISSHASSEESYSE